MTEDNGPTTGKAVVRAFARFQVNNSSLQVLLRIAVLFIAIVTLFLMWNTTFSNTFKGHEDYICDGENMQFSEFYRKKEKNRGKPFACKLKRYIDQWKISDQFDYPLRPINASNVVFVTYASSNHFHEARQAIRSMRSEFKNKIIVYDIGLNENEVEELSHVCNLEVRKFDFEKYPNFVSRLLSYHFKGIIMAEIFSEFEHFWLIDASIRFPNYTQKSPQFYAKISSGVIEPIVIRVPAGHSIFAATNPGMYEYLPIDAHRAKNISMLQAGIVFVTRSEMSRESIKWHSLCALTEDCFAPSWSRIPCWHSDRYNDYAYCNRYDQSSLNIITESLLERDGWKRRDKRLMRSFIKVWRDAYNKTLHIPCR